MVASKKSTTYQEVLPIFTVVLIMFQLIVPLIHSINDINNKLIAYSDCSQKMIDYAFLGKTLNFSKCYLNALQNASSKKPTCEYAEGKIVCIYEKNKYIFNLTELNEGKKGKDNSKG